MSRKLNNGQEIPCIGFGTWQLTDREVLLKALEDAYSIGYRHFDTAPIYGNEKIVGEFIQTKSRKDLFITSKLWNTDHDNVCTAIDKTLSDLRTDYLDLYLVHFPVNVNGPFNLRKLWEQMEECVNSKKAKSIGVANFGIKNVIELLSFCKIKPVVDQIELHPYLPQTEIKELCNKKDIQLISYSSLGSSSTGKEPVTKDSVIEGLSKKYAASPSQVILSFLVDEGYCVIPRSKSKEHIKENFTLIQLSDSDRQEIRDIKKRVRYVELPEFGPHRFD